MDYVYGEKKHEILLSFFFFFFKKKQINIHFKSMITVTGVALYGSGL